MRIKRANTFPAIPNNVEDFDNLLKNPNFGTFDRNISHRTFASPNDKFTLVFAAEIFGDVAPAAADDSLECLEIECDEDDTVSASAN